MSKAAILAVGLSSERRREALGMPYVLQNDSRTWMRLDRSLTIELTSKLPDLVRPPGPEGATGYVVATYPERITLVDRLWWRRRYP